MNAPEEIEVLRAELERDLELIRENAEKNRRMTERIAHSGTPDEFEYAAMGYTLHNLYTAFEAYFLRVAKFFENDLDQHVWHKALLNRMTLEVPGVRRAVIDRALAERLRELLAFRHVFRNIYGASLVPEKVLFANRAAENIDSEFVQYHQQFDRFLKSLAGELNNTSSDNK